MKAVIFDLDDTLYDQIQPFQKAVAQRFSIKKENWEPLYIAFRHYADEVFEQATSGAMPLKESHIYRMKQALADFGIQVTDSEALSIQQDYQTYQGQLELPPEFEAVFAYCQQNGLEMGLITNGPSLHQRRKIQSLQLDRWIKRELILISGEVGVTKPDVAIFRSMEEHLKLEPQECCYIGDSFENDVLGAKNAGWKAIWLNHRKRKTSRQDIQADAEIATYEQIIGVLEKFLGEG